MRLDPAAAAAGVRLIVHDVIGSTNAQALRLSRAGERGPLWVVALMQTAGRGRRGRNWVSQPSNLFATLLLNAPSPPAQAPQLSFVAAVALADALCAAVPACAAALTLKWPNDVLLDGAKVAGILIEAEGDSVAVGIGVNCLGHPPDTEFPAADLSAFAADAEAVFAALSATMAQRLAQWNRGAGFAAIRASWLDRAHGLGAPIRVRLPERDLTGRFDGLDAAGRLLLHHADGAVEPITAGDVFGFDSAPPRTEH